MQTADGVREARNRRVEIEVPHPARTSGSAGGGRTGQPAEPVQPTPVAEEKPDRFTFTLGPVYGHNFKEQDEGETENDLVGAELMFNALPGFLGGLSLKQGVFYAFNGEDGIAGRSVLSLDFAPDLGFVRPRLSANFGGVYGEGVQDGLVAGPELALDINLPGGFTVAAEGRPTTTSSGTRTGTRASSGAGSTSASASDLKGRASFRGARSGVCLSRPSRKDRRTASESRAARSPSSIVRPSGTRLRGGRRCAGALENG